jgi:methionyl-tRNA formyltransferase
MITFKHGNEKVGANGRSPLPYRIIFMGTSDFSVPPLQALAKEGFDISLVITQPDRPKGRGRKLAPPPVKKEALKLGIKDIIQPASMNSSEVYEILTQKKADIFVVVSFGHILNKKILNIPRIGAINIHASLLPKYRGSSPIQSAIINREKETGITTMLMDTGIDTGDILYTNKTEILPDDTADMLHDRLAVLGADLLIKTLNDFENIKPVPQNNKNATYAPILKKEDGRINWNNTPEFIDAFIRGMNSWPGAFTFLNTKRLKILKAEPVYEKTSHKPGTLILKKDKFYVAVKNGAVSLLKVQQESGKRLDIKDFLNSLNRLDCFVIN